MRRVVIVSDFHCGHRAGLTPPDWQYQDNPRDKDLRKFATEQRALWRFYLEQQAELKPVDVLIVNGDAIDGKGVRSGGTEQIVMDRASQVEMATECIRGWDAESIVMTYGTPYHTGADEDWEAVLARDVGAVKIGGHEWFDVDGVIFDCRHKVGRSIIPHGKFTAPARSALWNILWAERGIEPRANVLIRSHVHYHIHLGDARRLVMTTPCLQGFGSKYGARECEGDYDIGLIHFDCEGEGGYSWKPHLLDLKVMAPQVVRL